MDKKQQKEYYAELHQELADMFDVSPGTIAYIRSASISGNLSKQQIIDRTMRKLNSQLREQKALKKRITEREEIVVFLNKCTSDQFIKITEKQ